VDSEDRGQVEELRFKAIVSPISRGEKSVAPTVSRFELPDALRGLAVLLMLVFHSAYDLDHFNFLSLDLLHSTFWLAFQKVIVTLFVGVAGISLALAARRGLNRSRFWRREAVLVASAGLVSAGSYWLFPTSWIFFGVLHFMALASVMALPCLRLGGWNVLLGGVVLLLPWWINTPLFNAASLQWVGLGTEVTDTKDYTPFLPWFGVMLLGVYAGSRFERCSLCLRPLPRWRGLAGIRWLGRHSLVVYLAHQPLLMAFFWLVAIFIGVAEK
jgi:uncharacterized membrane protein